MGRGGGLGRRLGPPRFLLFVLVLVAAFVAYRGIVRPGEWLDPAAMAFDCAAVIFFASLIPLLRNSDAEAIRSHAAANDANRVTVLAVATLVAFAVLAAVSGELGPARAGEGVAIAKLVVTLLLAWLFANTIYALHYAHVYYTRDDRTGADAGGIDFPGTATPDYRDFAYFAGTLGMTFQTSDTAITSSRIRRIALLHGFVAFVFNIGVIAFAINALGGGAN